MLRTHETMWIWAGGVRCYLSIEFILLFHLELIPIATIVVTGWRWGKVWIKIVSHLKIVNNTRNEINITDKIFILLRCCDNYFFHQVSSRRKKIGEWNFYSLVASFLLCRFYCEEKSSWMKISRRRHGGKKKKNLQYDPCANTNGTIARKTSIIFTGRSEAQELQSFSFPGRW